MIFVIWQILKIIGNIFKCRYAIKDSKNLNSTAYLITYAFLTEKAQKVLNTQKVQYVLKLHLYGLSFNNW